MHLKQVSSGVLMAAATEKNMGESSAFSSSAGLGQSFIQMARCRWSKLAFNDTTGQSMTYGMALVSSLLLAKKLKEQLGDQDNVGILLPTGVGAALTNLALTLMGKVCVNINYTASIESQQSAIEQCGIKTLVSSKAFMEKLGTFIDFPNMICLEDCKESPSVVEEASLFASFSAVPQSMMDVVKHRDTQDMTAIIFSSGSTAEPKGVMLSHRNIMSNIEGTRQVFGANEQDNLCSALPFFHSFGYTASFWFPLITGMSVSFHHNPIDGATIANVVRENQSTMLFSTPTFLSAYLRRAKPEDFKSLRIVAAGAEKLKLKLSDKFEKKFGIRPLEGYGATELSPVAAFNLPNTKTDEGEQIGRKEGTVGRCIPGVTMKIVDPDSRQDLAHGQEGLLLVKGPNVMLGYLNKKELTEEAIQNGWYNTGDIAKIDDEGFVTITDRLSRFSKIGGEMIPHLAIEEVYANALDHAEAVLAVTSLPDDKKGEKLMVLYVQSAETLERLQGVMGVADVPNIWKPRKENYVSIESLPLLGTGKLDLKGLKALAHKASVKVPDLSH